MFIEMEMVIFMPASQQFKEHNIQHDAALKYLCVAIHSLLNDHGFSSIPPSSATMYGNACKATL
jgi:hypothetical protein